MVTQELPHWDEPYPYGHAAAINTMGTIAAPVLAGFTVALIGLVLSTPHQFRLVNLTLALLVVAALALVATLQFTFRARQFAVTPAEIEQWWPDANDPLRREELVHEQREHRTKHKKWANRARYAYDAGIVFFLAGLTAALIPPGTVSTGRLIVIIGALLGTILEFCWVAEDVLPKRRVAAESR